MSRAVDAATDETKRDIKPMRLVLRACSMRERTVKNAKIENRPRRPGGHRLVGGMNREYGIHALKESLIQW
jgi:hypothetical protein